MIENNTNFPLFEKFNGIENFIFLNQNKLI